MGIAEEERVGIGAPNRVPGDLVVAFGEHPGPFADRDDAFTARTDRGGSTADQVREAVYAGRCDEVTFEG